MISKTRATVTWSLMLMTWTAFAQSAILSQTPVKCPGSLAEKQLIDLITAKVPEPRVLEYVKQCGITFQVTADSEARLKRSGATPAIVAAIRARAPKVQPADKDNRQSDIALRAELDLWNTIRENGHVDVFDDYLDRYPRGQFVVPARGKIRELQETEVQQALRAHRWDAAQKALDELIRRNTDTANDKLTNWRKAIMDGRESERWIPFSATSENTQFALVGRVEGEYSVKAESVEVRLKIAQFTYRSNSNSPLKSFDGLRVSIGTWSDQSKGVWDLKFHSSRLVVGKQLKQEESHILRGSTFSIRKPLDLDLNTCWLALTLFQDSNATSYIHTDKDIFKPIQ